MAPRPSVEETRRRQIIDAALKCFARDGYEETSMDAIAAEAGLSKALLYYYYKNKDVVFESAFESWMAGITDNFASLLSEENPLESIRQFGEITASLGGDAEELFSLLLTYWAMAKRRKFLIERFRTSMRSLRARLVCVLDAGVQLGQFAPMDTRLVAVALFAALDGLWVHWMLDPEDVDLLAAAREIVSLFVERVGREEAG